VFRFQKFSYRRKDTLIRCAAKDVHSVETIRFFGEQRDRSRREAPAAVFRRDATTSAGALLAELR
jgi:hypothetical protein